MKRGSYLQIKDSYIANEVLRLNGNECYNIGSRMFLNSITSFAQLLKTDVYSNSDHDRLIEACVRYFRHTIHNKLQADSELMEVVDLLESLSLLKC